MYTVKTKGRGFAGTRAGVKFSMGVGKFEDEALVEVFERLGYTVEKPKVEKEVSKEEAPKKQTTRKRKPAATKDKE
ncbi:MULTISPECIES: hypothetical protein [unclassified Exiguobacterium]|uniref:hypothetical protein n=1 Tax=unclassified Exiguobacterium TaxID=2644629 RepID=UPI001BECA164|nr:MULTISPECIES: hypothetical protein [unclassified Exiguobacterium]